MLQNFIDATYIVSGLLFIMALAGLSRHETAKRGNAFGVLGMALALLATNFALAFTDIRGDGADVGAALLLLVAIVAGGAIGVWRALKVEMTGMPELIALLHSFVGAAAVLVGFNSFLDAPHADTFHLTEVAIGIFIGAVTLTGSIVAWGKLNGRIASKPLALPGRNWLNLVMLAAIVALGVWFVNSQSLVPLVLPSLPKPPAITERNDRFIARHMM